MNLTRVAGHGDSTTEIGRLCLFLLFLLVFIIAIDVAKRDDGIEGEGQNALF